MPVPADNQALLARQREHGDATLFSSDQHRGNESTARAARQEHASSDSGDESVVHVQEDAMPNGGSASDDTTGPPDKKRRTNQAPVAPVDWRVRRIVRDLGRLDVLRRVDFGPDVVSDDEEETAVDILVRKLLEDAEAGHVPAHHNNNNNDDDDDNDDDIGGGDYDDDYAGGAMLVDDGGGMDDNDFPPQNNDFALIDDAASIAVVTQNGDESFNGGGDDDEATDEASTLRNGEVDVVDFGSDDYGKRPSEEDTTVPQVPAAAANANADTKLLLTDVNYNHGARNPLNDPTAKPVQQPGDDDVYCPMSSLVRRQIEWFAASSSDLADRKLTGVGTSSYPITLGQVGLRCVHCAHIAFTARARGAVSYPSSYRTLDGVMMRYQKTHLMECKAIPSNIKSHGKTLAGLRSKMSGKERRERITNGFRRIGIIEKDGRLVYDKGSASAAIGRRSVIESDGSEDGYWLCDKCQLVKFATFEEACKHEETCCGTATKPDFGELDQSNRVFHQDDERLSPDSTNPTNEGEGGDVLSLCRECHQFEDPSSNVPILLCDGCDSATHLTCTMDFPKLTEVPEGDWFCSSCVLKKKRYAEDQAIRVAYAAIGDLLEDNDCKEIKKGRMLVGNLDQVFANISGIESKAPGKNQRRTCVVMGCKKEGGNIKCRYMCRHHFTRGRLLEQIKTMSNGERRFPCSTKHPSLPRDHDRAYVAIPPNAKHGALVKCSHPACRSLGKKKRFLGEKYAYCVVCDNICCREYFNKRHRHENGYAATKVEKKTHRDTADAVVEANAGETETTHGFDSICGHAKDRKRKGEYLFRVKWKNGEITSELDTYLREDDPATFVAYLKRSGLAKSKKYAWANEEHVH